jgi:hypothetical protein
MNTDIKDILNITGLIVVIIGIIVGLPILVYSILLWSKGKFGFENTVLFMSAVLFVFGNINKKGGE